MRRAQWSARGFSALQRAENSSIQQDRFVAGSDLGVSVLFSEPKIPQCRELVWIARCESGFSALQRAENSSIVPAYSDLCYYLEFQCSSASRKFLNVIATLYVLVWLALGFSALQRAENSSIRNPKPTATIVNCFSALQRAENSSIADDER